MTNIFISISIDRVISFWLCYDWYRDYHFKINLSDILVLSGKYLCYALRYLYQLKSKCYYNFKSMKQLWWKLKCIYSDCFLPGWLLWVIQLHYINPKSLLLYAAYEQLGRSTNKFHTKWKYTCWWLKLNSQKRWRSLLESMPHFPHFPQVRYCSQDRPS